MIILNTFANIVGPQSHHVYADVPGLVPIEVCLVTGTVRRILDGYVYKPHLQRSSCRWYWTVRILGRSYKVHRLVAAAAAGHELAPGMIVAHRNGNQHDNRAVNLRIGSALDNARDKIAHGSNGRKLRNADVREIRALAGRLATANIACIYRISYNHVRAIITRRRWAGLA